MEDRTLSELSAVKGFRAGIAGGVIVGLADALLAVAETAGGAPGPALAAFFISLTLWGMAGGCAGAIIFGLLAERRGPKDKPKTGGFAFLKREFLFAVSMIFFISLAGFLAGRTAVLISKQINFIGMAVGLVATGAAVLAIAVGWRTLSAEKRIRSARIGGIVGLVIAVLVFSLSNAKNFQTRKINTGTPGPSGPPPPGAAAAPNILLVVMDTVRADHLSLSGYARDTTPFLRRLAGESTVYDRAVSPSPWTMPSHASLFTGQYASVHQATFEHRYLSSEVVTLAELLKKSGYATAAFSANPNVSSAFNFQQGFDAFYELFRLTGLWDVAGLDPVAKLRALKWIRPVLGISRMKGSDRAAKETRRFVSHWLDSRSREEKARPYFIFINYMPAHLPYNPPPPFRKLFLDRPVSPPVKKLMKDAFYPDVWTLMATPGSMNPDDYAQLASLYDGEIAYLDSCLEGLIAMFRERGSLDNTVVIITSDHGENLGDHGGLLNHSFSIHQSVLHVPLLVRYPKAFAENRRFEGLVSTGSIFPTVLKLAGTSPAKEWPSAFGFLPVAPSDKGPEDVLSEYEVPLAELSALAEVPGADVSPYAVRQRAIQTESWKLVSRSDGKSFLFDLSADPGEASPLAPDSLPEGKRLEKILDDWRAGLVIPHFSMKGAIPAPDKATSDLLRSLGYLR
jgi:arylsulfatase A-like enzyme